MQAYAGWSAALIALQHFEQQRCCGSGSASIRALPLALTQNRSCRQPALQGHFSLRCSYIQGTLLLCRRLRRWSLQP